MRNIFVILIALVGLTANAQITTVDYKDRLVLRHTLEKEEAQLLGIDSNNEVVKVSKALNKEIKLARLRFAPIPSSFDDKVAFNITKFNESLVSLTESNTRINFLESGFYEITAVMKSVSQNAESLLEIRFNGNTSDHAVAGDKGEKQWLTASTGVIEVHAGGFVYVIAVGPNGSGEFTFIDLSIQKIK